MQLLSALCIKLTEHKTQDNYCDIKFQTDILDV